MRCLKPTQCHIYFDGHSGTFVTVGYSDYRIAAPVDGGWLPVMGALREFVRCLKPTQCHIYFDGQRYLCYCWLFLLFVPHCCTSGWLPVLGALREFVRRLKTKECDVYLDGRQYICYCCVFLIPLRHRWRILFCTLRTRQLVGTVLLYGLYTTARRYSNILLYTGYNLSVN